MGTKYEHSLATWTDAWGEVPVLEIPCTHCVHCGKVFPLPSFDPDKKASRIGRGFCYKCNGFICGEKCQNCVPVEKQNDIADSGRNPTAVSVPVLWTPTP